MLANVDPGRITVKWITIQGFELDRNAARRKCKPSPPERDVAFLKTSRSEVASKLSNFD
jgi:hypothetical protein